MGWHNESEDAAPALPEPKRMTCEAHYTSARRENPRRDADTRQLVVNTASICIISAYRYDVQMVVLRYIMLWGVPLNTHFRGRDLA